MFVQVIQGKVSDTDAVRARFDTWMSELAPGADGWLGSTAGVTDDGQLVVLARFESAEAAQRNSERPEQGAWWEQTAALFDGEPEFHDSSEVDVDTPGDPDQAGFVQVMQGRTADVARLREMTSRLDSDYPDMRPDLLGYITALHDDQDGAFTQVLYFTSEEEARAGERGEMPAEAAEVMREAMELIEDLRYHDIREPWLHTPG